MTKPTNTVHVNTTQLHRTAHGTTPSRCVALRLWGFDESEAQLWISRLSARNGTIAWKLSRVRHDTDADIVVHMVKPTRRENDTFCWHSIQANRAVLASYAAGRHEMILFAGTHHQLPPRRSGHWALTGKLSPQAALERLGRLIDATSTQRAATEGPVDRELLRMIAQQLDIE
ncbi:hypothetical protein R75777_04030 [Paraburkholderia nemoris]|nr:hypothetical protein R75777_04030 [Paraburkholderia nemoris]